MKAREPSLQYELRLGPAREMKAELDTKKKESKAAVKALDKLKPPIGAEKSRALRTSGAF
eukprot:SAG22_NODE_706_length_7763_cov_4.404228_8_plen_60_part_00